MKTRVFFFLHISLCTLNSSKMKNMNHQLLSTSTQRQRNDRMFNFRWLISTSTRIFNKFNFPIFEERTNGIECEKELAHVSNSMRILPCSFFRLSLFSICCGHSVFLLFCSRCEQQRHSIINGQTDDRE